MNKVKQFCSAYGGWVLLILPVVVVVLCMVVSAAKSLPRIIAEPPAETEVTFDMNKNHAYGANDGIIVIGEMVMPTATEMELAVSPHPVATAVKVGGAYTLPEDTQMEDGSIELLTIPKLNLSVNVYETDDELEAMTHGLAPQGQINTTNRIRGK